MNVTIKISHRLVNKKNIYGKKMEKLFLKKYHQHILFRGHLRFKKRFILIDPMLL